MTSQQHFEKATKDQLKSQLITGLTKRCVECNSTWEQHKLKKSKKFCQNTKTMSDAQTPGKRDSQVSDLFLASVNHSDPTEFVQMQMTAECTPAGLMRDLQNAERECKKFANEGEDPTQHGTEGVQLHTRKTGDDKKSKRKVQEEENQCGAKHKAMMFTTPSKPRSSPTSTTTSGNEPQSGLALTHSQPSVNGVDVKKPKLGGLVQGCWRKEAWTGGKPEPDCQFSKIQMQLSFPNQRLTFPNQ